MFHVLVLFKILDPTDGSTVCPSNESPSAWDLDTDPEPPQADIPPRQLYPNSHPWPQPQTTQVQPYLYNTTYQYNPLGEYQQAGPWEEMMPISGTQQQQFPISNQLEMNGVWGGQYLQPQGPEHNNHYQQLQQEALGLSQEEASVLGFALSNYFYIIDESEMENYYSSYI